MSSWRTALQEPDGKISASRVTLAVSLAAFFFVFLLWLVIMLGLFVDLWPWTRFEGALTAGGLGLLSIIFGAVAGYSVNKVASRGRNWVE